MLPLLGCNEVNIRLRSAIKVGGWGNDKVNCEGDGDTFGNSCFMAHSTSSRNTKDGK